MAGVQEWVGERWGGEGSFSSSSTHTLCHPKHALLFQPHGGQRAPPPTPSSIHSHPANSCSGVKNTRVAPREPGSGDYLGPGKSWEIVSKSIVMTTTMVQEHLSSSWAFALRLLHTCSRGIECDALGAIFILILKMRNLS